MGAIEIALDDGGTARFDFDQALNDTAATEYEVVLTVDGHHAGPPTRAVFARWRIEDPALAESFESSRRELFGLRRTNIDSFVCDLLLRPVDADGQEYVVIGAYADEEGLGQARAHPAIAAWATDRPPSTWTALDLTGMCTGDITEWDPR